MIIFYNIKLKTPPLGLPNGLNLDIDMKESSLA